MKNKELETAIAELRDAGQRMSNWFYNEAQQSRWQPGEREAFGRMVSMWDAADNRLHSALNPRAGAGPVAK